MLSRCHRPRSVLSEVVCAFLPIVLTAVFLFWFPSLASATPVTLAWDAVSAPELAGYKLYYGYASRSYSLSVNVGEGTTAALSGLDQAKMYYLAVVAYDARGNESDFSNEVIYDLAKVDTDGDGLNDWDEIDFYKTNPNKADTDGDGLSDGEEVTSYGTDPRQADTDGDGVRDGAEVKQGTNPKDPSSVLPQNVPELPRSQMTLVSVDSEEVSGEDGRADHAIDGDPRTIWHTQWSAASPKHPHEMVIRLGSAYTVGGFTYLPRQDGTLNGTVANYSFYVSADGVNWGQPVASGTFAKDANKKQVLFAGRAGQFVRFVAQSEVNGSPWTSAAEINILGAALPPADPKPVPPTAGVIWAVNAGGLPFTAADGTAYRADALFSGGGTNKTTAAIAGTADDALYQSERYGAFVYEIPVPNGNYVVTLKFAELFYTAVGKRVFDVLIEGATVVSKLDVFARVGRNTAYDVQVSVRVTDGMLNIIFHSIVNHAKVNAITISTP